MRKTISLLITALCAFVLLNSCSNSDSPKYKIGVSQCSTDAWRAKMNREFMLETVFYPNLSIDIRSANDNSTLQIAQIDSLIASHVDLIIVAPNIAADIQPAIDRAMDKDIPVVVVDRNVAGGGKCTAYVGANSTEIGRMAGRYVASQLGGNGNVVEIMGLQGSTPEQERHNGFHEVMALHPGIKVTHQIHANWNRDEAYARMDSLLATMPEGSIDFIYAHNDRMAEGAYDAMRKHYSPEELARIKTIGVDALTDKGGGVEAIMEGRLTASLLYPTNGEKVIETALKILNNEPYPATVEFPSALVDKSNAEILYLQSREIDERTAALTRLGASLDKFFQNYSLQRIVMFSFMVIVLLLAWIIYYVIKSHQNKERINQELEAQREKVKDALNAKLNFYTNVSHDLRTPLTLIADPVRIVAQSTHLNEQEQTLMNVANKNVKILLRLINQILDLRKYESGRLALNLVNGNIKDSITEWATSFMQLARKRSIHFDVEFAPGDYNMAYDAEKMERVMFNMLGNAFKYSPDNARVGVSVARDGDTLTIKVSDTGFGIPKGELDNIFDRFYQIDKTQQMSSGIGLALVKSFVELHGGTIAVESEAGKGTTFTITMPTTLQATSDMQGKSLYDKAAVAEELAEVDTIEQDENSTKPYLLVIDDVADIRTLISTLMSDRFNVIEANDGPMGIRMATRYTPDLIISDVMMPTMDGWEVCRRLKNQTITSHIPVLMLTACTQDEQRIITYESGADGFLPKPFDSRLLATRIDNLIENRKRIRDFFADTSHETPATTDGKREAINDLDREFVNRFKAIVEKEMGNSELGVETIGEQMNLSRVQLYRKIKSLTNYSPVELIRLMRLKRAHQLLSQSDESISEIAYKVGFSSPSYFTKCYTDHYSCSPTDTKRQATGQ